MFRFIVLLISFGMLAVSLNTMLDYWRYDEKLQDVAQLMKGQVTTQRINQEIEQALAADNPEDARMYLDIGKAFGFTLDETRLLARIDALEAPWHITRRQTGRFIDGFLDGEAESSAGVAGAITADFTVIGDVRDLSEQYDLYSEGKDVNTLIATLAGVGVGLTAATLVSGGTAAPAKSGVSALKMASRSGKLTPKLQNMLLRQGQAVFNYQRFLTAARGGRSVEKLRHAAVSAYNPKAMSALGQTTERVNSIRQSTSLLDTINLLRYVENGDDLRRLEKVSLQYGTQTKGIMKLVGKGAIGSLRVLRHGTELFISLMATLVSFVATLFSVSSLFRRKRVA